jgi:hypothetical protein
MARLLVGEKVAVEAEHVIVPGMATAPGPARVKVDEVTVAQFTGSLKTAETA